MMKIKNRFSPKHILLIVASTIFIFEGILMYILSYFQTLPIWFEGIIDAMVLTIAVFPVLYYFVFRPLLQQFQVQKKVERELKLRKESFDNIVRKSANGVLVVDHNGIIQFMNPAAEVLLNSREKVNIGFLFQYQLELDTVRNIEIMRNEVDSGTGELRVVETEWGGRSAYLVDIRDISDRIRDEETLRRNEEQFRSVTLSATDAIVGLDGNGRISIWNEAASKMFGYSEEEVLEKNLHDLLLPERYRKEAKEGLKNFIKTGEGPVIGKTLELVGLRKDGSQFPLELSVSAWHSGDSWCATGAIRDITERKEAEEKLKRSEEKHKFISRQLAETNSMKELLLDVITHDLKNPVGVIKGFAELLLDENPENEMVQSIEESSDNLLKVIENASALAGAALGESIEKQNINLSTIVEDAITEYEQKVKHEKIEIEFNPPGDIFVYANPILSEVFKNYLSNAIKYAKRGKRIIIEIEEDKDFIQVGVKDFGQTIPEDDRKTIFQRQTRLDNGEKGRGLGLAIVKRIAMAHHGEVWVEPNKPTGNVFYLKIPIKVPLKGL